MTQWVDYKVTSPQLDDPASPERLTFLARLTGRAAVDLYTFLPPYMVVSIERNPGKGKDVINDFMKVIRTGLRMPVTWEYLGVGLPTRADDEVADRYVVIPISHPFNPHNNYFASFKGSFEMLESSQSSPRPKSRGIRALEDIPGGGNAMIVLEQALGPNFADLFSELPPAEVMRQYLLKAGYTSDPQSVIALAAALYPDRIKPIREGDVLSGIEWLEIDDPKGERIIINVYQGSVIMNGRTLQISSSGIASTVATKANKDARFVWD